MVVFLSLSNSMCFHQLIRSATFRIIHKNRLEVLLLDPAQNAANTVGLFALSLTSRNHI